MHNGHKTNGDVLLPGVTYFWSQIPEEDIIILLSARDKDEEYSTLNFLRTQGLRFNYAIFGLPTGERVLINDIKPLRLLSTAHAVNVERDFGLGQINIEIIDDLC